MKKLILLFLLLSSSLFAQTATNKIQNTATIFSTNSPVLMRSILSVESNMSVGGVFEAGTNASAGKVVGTHFLVNSNAGNPVLVLRNYDPSGYAQFYAKTSSGVDAAAIGTERNGSNVLIHAFLNALSYVRIATQTGASANELFIHPSVTTNTFKFVAGAISSTNYQVNGVRGQTLSVTNLGAVIGTSNVEVFAEGILTNKFTIP